VKLPKKINQFPEKRNIRTQWDIREKEFGHWLRSQFCYVTYPSKFPFLAFNIERKLFPQNKRLDLHIHRKSLPAGYTVLTTILVQLNLLWI
jgi:hypothetical protein